MSDFEANRIVIFRWQRLTIACQRVMSSSTSCGRNKSVSNVRYFEPWPVAIDTNFFLLPFSLNITRDFIITMLLNAAMIRRTTNVIREIRFVRGATHLMCLCSARMNVIKVIQRMRRKIKLPKSLLSVLTALCAVLQHSSLVFGVPMNESRQKLIIKTKQSRVWHLVYSFWWNKLIWSVYNCTRRNDTAKRACVERFYHFLEFIHANFILLSLHSGSLRIFFFAFHILFSSTFTFLFVDFLRRAIIYYSAFCV